MIRAQCLHSVPAYFIFKVQLTHAVSLVKCNWSGQTSRRYLKLQAVTHLLIMLVTTQKQHQNENQEKEIPITNRFCPRSLLSQWFLIWLKARKRWLPRIAWWKGKMMTQQQRSPSGGRRCVNQLVEMAKSKQSINRKRWSEAWSRMMYYLGLDIMIARGTS